MMASRGPDIRLSPAEGKALLNEVYDLRARDGKVICTVPRIKAEQGIAMGRLELWQGRHGAYLRPVDLSYPEQSRQSEVSIDSRHTVHGTIAAAPANVNRLHRHNPHACAAWTQPKTVTPSSTDKTALRNYGSSKVTAPQISRAMTTRWKELTGNTSPTNL